MKKFNDFINEAKGKDDEYGVKSKLAPCSSKEGTSNPDTENTYTKEDKKVLSEIMMKANRGIQILSDLEKFIESFEKISPKPVTAIIDQLQAFNESINKQLEK